MMKICVATSTFPAHPQEGQSAAGFFVRDFALALAEADCEVHVLTQRNGAERTAEPPGICVTRFPWRSSGKRPSTLQFLRLGDIPPIIALTCGGAIALSRLARRERFDCVLAMWTVPAGLWALTASLFAGSNYCVWALGSDIWDYGENALFRPMLRLILRRSVKNYADGMGLVESVSRIAGTPCTFLPSARRLRRPAAAELPRRDRPQFLFIGRWHPNKGIDVLLEAMALLHEDDVQVHLDVYGGGPLEARLRKIVKDHALPTSLVTLHGYIGPDGAARAIQSADCVVIPSRIDSIPVILSDAVSLGKPVIATNVGDTGGLVAQRRCGLTCPPQDPVALAGAIRAFIRTQGGVFSAGVAATASLFDIGRAARSFLEDLRRLNVDHGETNESANSANQRRPG